METPLVVRRGRHFQGFLNRVAQARRDYGNLCLACVHAPCEITSCLPEGFGFEEDPPKVAFLRELRRVEDMARQADNLARQPVDTVDRRARRMAQEVPNLMRRIADLEKALGLWRQTQKKRLRG
jgi:hypothetical protein